jgi:hypothetical protein
VTSSWSDLWINNFSSGGTAGIAVNRPSHVMAYLQPIADPFQQLRLPAFTNASLSDLAPAREVCRRYERLIAALNLGRRDRLVLTEHQVTLRLAGPDEHDLVRRVPVLEAIFAEGRGQAAVPSPR